MAERLRILDTDTSQPRAARASIGRQPSQVICPQAESHYCNLSGRATARGRLAQIAKARSEEQFRRAYFLLEQTLRGLCKIQKFSFDEEAQQHFIELKKLKLRTGTLDLRIAAIALSNNAILVTRNRQDFANIPNLDLEDLSVMEKSAA